VLLVITILLAITSRLLANHNLVINQHQMTFEQDQALQYALGAETLAIQALFEDFERLGPGKDHLGEIWAEQTLPFELDEGGFIEAQLKDMHGCFNANSITGENGKEQLSRFKQLLRNLNLPDQLADSWRDWIDDDTEPTGFGAEDSEYLVASPPHRTPNHLVTDTAEFSLLQNIEAEQVAQLLPHICLLPDADTKINVNTATAQTLAALDSEVSIATAEGITAELREYDDEKKFVETYPSLAAAAPILTVKSEYFELHAQAQVGESTVTLRSSLYRDPSTGQITVLQRDFGKLFRSNLQISTEEAEG
jgi:general secretion pathway protein K